MTVIQYLQKYVKHFGRCLFNFIKQNNRIRVSAHLFTELTALFVAHIARRRTDHTGNTVFFHIFRHINTHHGIFIAKQCLCQCLGKLRFTHTCRPQEQERTNGSVGIFQPDTATAHCFGKSLDRFLLANDTLMQGFFQTQKSLTFFFF